MTSAGYCEFFEHIILYHLTHFFQVSGALQTLIYPAIERQPACPGLPEQYPAEISMIDRKLRLPQNRMVFSSVVSINRRNPECPLKTVFWRAFWYVFNNKKVHKTIPFAPTI